MLNWVLNLIIRLVIKIIAGYQYFISPYFAPSCRFEVSCSEYTKLAIIKNGLIKGIISGLHRLIRCQPFFNPCNHGYNSKNSENIS